MVSICIRLALSIRNSHNGFVFTVAQKITLHPSGKNLETYEHHSYAIICESPNAEKITWYDPKNNEILEKRNKNRYVEQNSHTRQLVFSEPTRADSGVYTCKADEEIAKVNLTVIIKDLNKNKNIHRATLPINILVLGPITFGEMKNKYYVRLGDNITIFCEPKSMPPAQVTWLFNGNQINGTAYRLLDGNTDLYIMNMAEDKLGIYTCKAILTTELSSDVKQFDITVKLAVSPSITSIHPNNTVYAVANNTVRIVCRSVAEPSADLQWCRNGKKLHLGEMNATIEQKDNESTLKTYFANAQFLGQYTCNATNEFGSASINFTVEETIFPNVPVVHVKESYDKGFRFNIYQSPPMQNLTNFKIEYKKLSDNSTKWQDNDLPLKNTEIGFYSLNNLDPNTEYEYKIGACVNLDLCAFTNLSRFKTTEITTGSASSIMQTLLTQCIILLPAFLISFYTQHYQ
ncbi:hypothetical protein PGB90_006050 [Kerria lacca]